MPSEPQYMGVTHIFSNSRGAALCGHMIGGGRTGHYRTNRADFINRICNGSAHRWTHCHWCEATLTDFDVINATDV